MSKYDFRKSERADADSLNKRMSDIHLRLAALENERISLETAKDDLVSFGLQRIEEALLPAFESIQDKAHLGALLSATCEQSVDLDQPLPENIAFLITQSDRETFAPAGFLIFTSLEDPEAMILASLVAYDADTGVLSVKTVNKLGTGAYLSWHVTIGATPSGLDIQKIDAGTF